MLPRAIPSSTRTGSMDESSCIMSKSLRTIYLTGEITPVLAAKFRRKMSLLSRGNHEPITIEINSTGGDIQSGMLMIDTIVGSPCEVTTLVTGNAMSMASMVLLAGDVRKALPSAVIMVHQGTYRLRATYQELKSEVAELERTEVWCWDFMDRRTSVPAGTWEKRCPGVNFYMTADQALELGVLTEVIK